MLSLKDQNAIRLYAVVAANLAFFIAMQRSEALLVGDWSGMAADWESLVPATVGMIFLGIIAAQVDPNTKAQLVFGRRLDPLPGSEAFSRWGPADPRVDMPAIESAYGPLPTERRDQNRLWYRLYKSVDQEPATQHAHKESLFARDYTFLAALMVLFMGGAAFISFGSIVKAAVYTGLMLVQFALVRRAARHHGERLVCTVLALVGAKAERAPAA